MDQIQKTVEDKNSENAKNCIKLAQQVFLTHRVLNRSEIDQLLFVFASFRIPDLIVFLCRVDNKMSNKRRIRLMAGYQNYSDLGQRYLSELRFGRQH